VSLSVCHLLRFIRRKIGLQIFLLPLLLAIALSATLAQDSVRIEDLERRMRDLEQQVQALGGPGTAAPEQIAEIRRQIDVLTREIENLKLGEAAPAPERGAYGLGPAASKVYGVRRGVSLGGYGELLYENFDGSDASGAPSGREDKIDLLRLVLYFGYKFNDRILFNSELEFEHATTGEGAEEKGEVSVEFAYLDFLHSDEFNARAGLVLVPVGFINELHEPPIFLGARRPFVEQRILPTTWREIGFGVFGDAGPVTYRAYVVSSLASVGGTSSQAEGFTDQGIRGGRASGSQAAAEDFALTGRLDFRPVGGLLLGASFFTGDTGQGRATPTGERIDGRTTLWDAHAEFRFRGIEARALYARTSIGDVARINAAQTAAGVLVAGDSVGERQVGAYAEVGFDVMSLTQKRDQALVPYVRWERYDTQERIPAGLAADPANDVRVTTFGVAWKPIVNVALKADFNRIENEARTGVDQLNVALGFLF